MLRQFHKMHGLGNDFAIFDARETPLTIAEPLAKRIADRRIGVGCDQLILIEPSERAEIRMRIWNHDGGEVQSCGNASRCVVALTGARTIETGRSEEHTSELQSRQYLVCRLLLEKKKKNKKTKRTQEARQTQPTIQSLTTG